MSRSDQLAGLRRRSASAAAPTTGPAWRWGRIAVVGPSAAGKSWLSVRIAERAGLRYVQLDRLRWPNYQLVDDASFAAGLAEATGTTARSVVEGTETSPAVLAYWHDADLLLWLDHRSWAIAARLGWFGLLGLARGTWVGHESRRRFALYVLRKIRRSVRQSRQMRGSLPARLAELRAEGVEVVRLPSRTAVNRWLDTSLPVE